MFASGAAWFVGPAETADLIALPVGTEIRGLRIGPGCIGAVSGLPAHELANRTVGLDELVGTAAARELAERVWSGPSVAALPRFSGLTPPRTRRLVRELLRHPSTATSTLTATLPLSERQLRRLVLDEAGLPPKTLQKVARMHRFLADVEQRSRPLAVAAAAAGYADQAHVSRDIRQLTGLPPTRLLAERRSRVAP